MLLYQSLWSRFSMISRDLKTARPLKHIRIMMAPFKAPCFRHQNSNQLVPRSVRCSRFWGLGVVPVHKTKRKTVSFISPMENDQLIKTFCTSHLKLFFGFLLGILAGSYLLKKALNLEKEENVKDFQAHEGKLKFLPSSFEWHQLKP